MHVEDLYVEITRKCNLRCDHCMRGNAQRKSITDDVLNNLFRRIDSVGTLTIGGGEPSLAIKEIESLRYNILYNNVSIENVFIATNGKRVSKDMIEKFLKIREICGDKSSSYIGVSNDEFHQWARGFHRNLYDYEYALYSIENVWADPSEVFHEHTRDNTKGWFNRGRAKGWGDRTEPYLDNLKLDSFDNPTRISGQMYVCYNGDVIGDVNASYLDMKKMVRGNVSDWYNLIENLKQSTIDTYTWCKENCDGYDGCGDLDEDMAKEVEERQMMEKYGTDIDALPISEDQKKEILSLDKDINLESINPTRKEASEIIKKLKGEQDESI